MTLPLEHALIFALITGLIALGIGYAGGYDFGKRAGHEQAMDNVFPQYRERRLEAVSAGLHTCHACSFVYYRTIDHCPKCGEVRVE